MTRTTLLLATLVAGCATSPASDGSPAPGGGKADGALASIAFDADFSETVAGALVAGATIRIDYDLARMPTCRGATHGSEAWGIGGYAQFDDGAPVPFAVSRLVDHVVEPVAAEIAIPASATHVAFWFEQTDVFGCHAYDSNDSANYNYDVAAHPGGAVLAFDADGSRSQSGAVHAGDAVVVHYDPARLATCAGSTGGHAAWGITGYWQVDGGAVHALAVARADGSALVPADPTFTVPAGRDLALWFEATSVWGCHAYDSASGANYHVAVD